MHRRAIAWAMTSTTTTTMKMTTMATAGIRLGTSGRRRNLVLVHLALSYFHNSRTGGSSHALSIENVLRHATTHAGVSKILFLRHGQTAPSSAGIDFDRKLTEQGQQQAQRSGQVFGQSLAPFFPLALVSPAPRAVETAQLFFRCSGCSAVSASTSSGRDSIQLVLVPNLYDGTMPPAGSRIFRTQTWLCTSGHLSTGSRCRRS